MSDNCFKLYLIDGNLQLISHEEAEEIERRNRMVPDLALLLVEIQNMRKRWADEDAALTDFHLYGVLFTDYECDGDVTADA